MRCASLSSGLLPRSGSLCEITRPRFVSMTSVVWQQGQVISSSDFSRAIAPSYVIPRDVTTSLHLMFFADGKAGEATLGKRHLQFERRPVGQLRRHADVAQLLTLEIEAVAETFDERVERRLKAAVRRHRLRDHPVM